MAYDANQLQLTGVLQRLYHKLGGKVSLATGGTTTTIVDTKLAVDLGEGSADDFLNGGTVILITDAGGANAAPEGEFSRITAYDSTSNAPTITFSPAFTVAPASGDRYLFAPPDYPLYDVIEVVNDALRSLTELPKYDTSITTTDNQTEYTLPLAVKGGKVLMVEMQTYTSDANDNRWVEVPRWREGFAAAGSTGTFILPQLSSGYTIRITYQKIHPRVTAYADYIDEFYHPDLVNACVLAYVVSWKNDQDRMIGDVSDAMRSFEEKAWSLYDRARIVHHVATKPKSIQTMPQWSSIPKDDFKPIPKP